MKILYIGNELNIVEYLSMVNEIDVIGCIYQGDKVSFDGIHKDDNYFLPVSSKDEFKRKMEIFYEKIDFAIMYSFGIILPKEVIDRIMVYNFHPGDLRTNRGSSPIEWSILLNEKRTMMTLHSVDVGIDTGIIMAEHECNIYENDVPYTVKKRMEGEIPSMMLELLQLRKENWGGTEWIKEYIETG